MKSDHSPRATGPAGPQFEVKVATHYALAVLAQTEAFGLPGAVAEEIAFQRGAQGHPLDDVIVKGITTYRETRTLDLQVKRAMAFTAGDANFESIVKAIVETRRDLREGQERRYAVALERTSGPIENGVQETLQLARSVESASAFYSLLNTRGRSNGDMRRFVEAFRMQLDRNDVADEDVLFSILKQFSVIVFDYARPNSIAEAYDRMRAKLLTSGKADKDLYDSLYGHMMQLDSIGGDKTREGLIEDLRELGVSLAYAPHLARARTRLDEMSLLALKDINQKVHDVSIVRDRRNREIEEALDAVVHAGGVVEIAGPGGVGKSALLKEQAFRRREVCRILALAPDRSPKGGWPELRHMLEIDAEAKDFFADLACDGGSLVCIDGLDRFRDSGEQKTVIDVLRFATANPGFVVLFTARTAGDGDQFSWLPDDVQQTLAARRTVIVEELYDEEAEALGTAAPELAPLLKSDHPARPFSRNLFILRRLAAAGPGADKVLSESQLAADWWVTGGHGPDVPSGARRARRRVLEAVAQSMLSGASLADVSDHHEEAVEGLVAGDVLAELGSLDRVKFQHDLFSDWALGGYLSDDPSRIDELDLSTPPPYWLSRAFELACRRIAEGVDETAYESLLGQLSEDTVAPGWLGLALLALVRSEQAEMLLERYVDTLLLGDGGHGALLIRRALSAHSRLATDVFAGYLPSDISIPEGLTLPSDPVLVRLIVWTAKRFDQLPAKTMAAALELYEQWMVISVFMKEPVTATLLGRVVDLLVAHIEYDEWSPATFPRSEPPPIRYPVDDEGVSSARNLIALYAQQAPDAAARYLEAVAASERAISYVEQLLEFSGNLPTAAPAAFAAAVRRAVELEITAARDDSSSSRQDSPFWRLDAPFVLGRVGIGFFFAILKTDEATGLSLIRDLLRDVEQWTRGQEEGFSLLLFGAERRVAPYWSYGWSRGTGPSDMLSAALGALEHWGHHSIEGGRPLDNVIAQLLGDEEISGALLSIAVDLVLSHGKIASPILWDLLSSPEILSLDTIRYHRDIVCRDTGSSLSSGIRSGNAVDLNLKEELCARPSRKLALRDLISQVIWSVKESETQALRERLGAAVKRLGTWDRGEVDWFSPKFMASHAFRLASRENYERASEVGADGRKREEHRFIWPEPQRRWRESQSAKAAADQASFSRALIVRMAMDNDSSELEATLEMADEILAETADARPSDTGDLHDPKDPWINRIAAAAFVARYESVEILRTRRTNLTRIFDQALAIGSDSRRYSHKQIMYNPQALAITGLLYIASRSKETDKIRRLLHAVSQDSPSAATAFLGHKEAVKALGARVVQAAVRVGLETCVFARSAHFEEDPDAYAARLAAVKKRYSKRLATEDAWLFGDGGTPSWVCPPPRRARRPRLGIRVPGGTPGTAIPPREPARPDFYFNDRTAANWTRCLTALGPEASDPVKALVLANKNWLMDTNAGEEDVEQTWTKALMERAAEHAKMWTSEERQNLVFDILTAFSDDCFIQAAATLLVQSDLQHIKGVSDETAYLVELRRMLWERLKETRHWRRHLWSSSSGMEIHLNELIAAFFFKICCGLLGSEQSYTAELCQDQLVPFFPILTEISIDAEACPVIASYLLDVFDNVEDCVTAPFVLNAATSWISGADTLFWNGLGIGRSICTILKAVEINPEITVQLAKIADAVSAAGVIEGEILRTVATREVS